MLNSNLYAIREPNLEQHLRDNCSTRLESMVLLVAGMFQAGSVCLSKIAGKLSIDAQKLSLTRRLRRFLDSDTGCWHLVPFFGGSVRGARSRQTTLHGGSERPEHGMTSNACQPPSPLFANTSDQTFVRSPIIKSTWTFHRQSVSFGVPCSPIYQGS